MDDLTIFNKKNPSDTMEAEKGLFERLEAIETAVKLPQSRAIDCPASPIEIPGIVADNAFDANDCFGTMFIVDVPKSGIIYSATYWDMDDEGSQIDFFLFKATVTDTASDAAFAPTDSDLLNLVTILKFTTFTDSGTGQTAEITNIGKAYNAPAGKFYIKAVTRSTPNIAAGNMPRLQMQILSDDPNF